MPTMETSTWHISNLKMRQKTKKKKNVGKGNWMGFAVNGPIDVICIFFAPVCDGVLRCIDNL